MVLTLTHCLWPSGSRACGRMLTIQFKFRHMSGVSTTAGASLAQNTRESRRGGGKNVSFSTGENGPLGLKKKKKRKNTCEGAR